MRLRAIQERPQDVAEAEAILHEVARRHSKQLVLGVTEEGAGAVVHVDDARAARLEDDDRIGLSLQSLLELRLDRLGALLVFDVGERSNPGENVAGRASLRHRATEVPAK